MEGRRWLTAVRASAICCQLLLAAAVGALVPARLNVRMDVVVNGTKATALVCYMSTSPHICSWAMAVMAVGLLLPAATAVVLIFGGGSPTRWLPITEFVLGAFGFAWWGLFAAVDTGVALRLRKITDYREMERGAVWAMAWAETALFLVSMCCAMAAAGGPRSFFRPRPPASPTTSKLLREPPLPPTV